MAYEALLHQIKMVKKKKNQVSLRSTIHYVYIMLYVSIE